MMTFKEFYLNEEINYFYHGSAYEFDQFDINKVGSGDGLNKFGYGLYFTDSESLAEYYASENYKAKGTGLNIYKVKLYELEYFYPWEEECSEEIYSNVIRSLTDLGYEKDANDMQEEYEEYGDRWPIRSLYKWLASVFGSSKEVTKFLYKNGISGVIADDIDDRGKIYVAFSDRIIKIVDTYKVGERQEDDDF